MYIKLFSCKIYTLSHPTELRLKSRLDLGSGLGLVAFSIRVSLPLSIQSRKKGR